MRGLKRATCGWVAVAAIACAPMTPAVAGGHGFGLRPWGLGHGLIGAAVGLATLPIVVASAAISAVAPEGPYAPPAAAYYPRPPVYYPARSSYAPYAYAPYAPRTYYSPRPLYAPRPYYAPGHYGYSGGNAGRYAYPHR